MLMLRTKFILPLVLGIVCLALNGDADNVEMMRRHAEDLVELNERVVREIPDLPENSTVLMQADVLRRDGQSQVRIEHIQILPDLPAVDAADRSVSIRADETGDDGAPAGSQSEERESTDATSRSRVLSAEEIRTLDWGGRPLPARAVVVYWES